MNLFPTKEVKFRYKNTRENTHELLIQKTDVSKNLTSGFTKKPFRGMVYQTEFKIISSLIGFGAFCVMTGSLEPETGTVKIKVHNAFKILLSILVVFPFVAISIFAALKGEEITIGAFVPVLLFLLMFRFLMIGLGFKILAMFSLDRLRNELNIEWVK